MFDNKTEHFYVQLDEDKDEIYDLRWVGWRALKKKEPGGHIGLTAAEYLEPGFNRKELVFKQSWVDDMKGTKV